MAAQWPKARAPKGAEPAGGDPLDARPLWVDHPWLLRDWHLGQGESAEPAGQSSGGAGPGGQSSGGAGAAGRDVDLCDMDVDEVFDELKQFRANWQEREVAPHQHFKVSIRGGAWTAAHRGVAADSVRGEAGTTESQRFQICELSKSATFSVSKYTEHFAHRLAEAWCHRIQFWFDLGADRGSFFTTRFLYSDESLYEAPGFGGVAS